MNRRLPTLWRRAALIAAILASVLTLAACGQTPQDAVKAKVQDLAQAIGQRDWARICQQILAPSLVRRLNGNGIPCQDAMRVALGGIRNPEVSVGKVVLRGPRAWAITLTAAQGQRATLTAIALRRLGGDWRITSLDSPLSAAQGR